MIYYKPIKIIIDNLSLIKIMFNIIIKYYNILDFINSKKNIIFLLKFLSLLCHFLI